MPICWHSRHMLQSNCLSLRKRFKKLRNGTISRNDGMDAVQSRETLDDTVMHPRSWPDILIESPSG